MGLASVAATPSPSERGMGFPRSERGGVRRALRNRLRPYDLMCNMGVSFITVVEPGGGEDRGEEALFPPFFFLLDFG
jgi:hypothetical protein